MAYTSFAEVYDTFMDNVPYGEWCGYLTGLLRDFGVSDGLVAELGCGTGTMTELLSARGYDMIGVDISEDMLSMAMEKRDRSGSDILYLCQDMRELELYGTVRAVVSVCDSMNYLTEYRDLVKVMGLANNYLDPGGVFIFDLNTVYKYRELLGNRTFAEDREHESFIWENTFDEESGINEYGLSIFVDSGLADGDIPLYHKYEETHYQRAYSLDEVERAAREAGMRLEAVYAAFTRKDPAADSERVYVILREQGKERG